MEDLPVVPVGRGRPPAGPGHRKPEWLKVNFVTGGNYLEVKRLLRSRQLHSVCEEARCPNQYECWSHRTATFMILGSTCTRACGFCAVHSGRPTELDRAEPQRVGEAVAQMGLRHVVVTAVARDDLDDGGAGIFADTIREIRRQNPGTAIEVLIPDFGGNWAALGAVMAAEPDILNHNIETVPRLTPYVRSRFTYQRSLEVLRRAREIKPSIPTKSGIMLGLGETRDEVLTVMTDLRGAGVEILTIGQYLQPTVGHLQVVRYVHPDEFQALKDEACRRGFRHCESGPLVRSSYHAWTHAETVLNHAE